MSNCGQAVIMRGTTVSNTFSVDIDLREATVYAWYAQGDKLLLKKCSAIDNQILVSESTFVVNFTQEETLMFSQKSKDTEIKMQFGYVFQNGVADRSNIIYATVGAILSDEVMQYVQGNV